MVFLFVGILFVGILFVGILCVDIICEDIFLCRSSLCSGITTLDNLAHEKESFVVYRLSIQWVYNDRPYEMYVKRWNNHYIRSVNLLL